MIKRALGLLLLLVLFACSAEKHAAIPQGSNVLALGDSVTYGTGAEASESYPELLAAKTGWRVINAGVAGNTSADALTRLPELLEQHTPRLILVELGGNDFLRHVALQETIANLKAVLSLAKAHGIPVVLVAVPRPNLLGAAVGHLSDDPIYQTISRETGTPVVKNVLSDVLSQNTLKSDPIHPNAQGYRRMANELALALQELGFSER
ncbi:MAG: arylesterase [Methylophilaceae bacterium]